MRILVLSVGRPERKRLGPIFDDYAERIRRFGVRLDARFVPEIPAGGRYSDSHVREREGRALREAFPEKGRVVALDSRGASFTSAAFARRLESWATPLAVLVIGGPLGLEVKLRDEANEVVSLSSLTLPHDLARVVLAEQLYRAITLLRGVPYHK